MTEIAYTYEIVSADSAARCMEIVYRSPGRIEVRISARLPYVGEAVESVVHMYAPVSYWREQEMPVVSVTPGQFGEYLPPGVGLTSLDSARQAKVAEIAAWRHSVETQGVVVNGVQIDTDRESQATLSGAYASLRDGLIQSVDWKSASGAFTTLGLPEVTTIARLVAQHVQASFSAEKKLIEAVYAAQTIEEVKAVFVPWSPSGVSQIPVTEA